MAAPRSTAGSQIVGFSANLKDSKRTPNGSLEPSSNLTAPTIFLGNRGRYSRGCFTPQLLLRGDFTPKTRVLPGRGP